jgi:hypothetical protein
MICGQRVKHREYNTTGVITRINDKEFVVKLDGWDLSLDVIPIKYIEEWGVINDDRF